MNPLRLWIALNALLLLTLSGDARAQVPHHLNHQGLLTNNAGVIVPDGVYELRFEVHETPAVVGPPLFYQQLTVNVVKGLYNVLLSDNAGGVLVDAFDGATRYLQIGIVTSPGGTYNGLVLSPRQQIASVPYALVAERVAEGPPEVPPYPPGHLHGLTLVRTAADRVQIQPGSCRDTGDAANLVLSAALTKQIDTGSWAVGNSAGGLAGPVEAGLWYHVFLIANDEGTIDAGYDTSFTAQNLLSQSGYTSFRRLGSVKTDPGSAILDFVQEGDEFLWRDPPLDVTENQTGTYTRALSVPPGLKVWALVNAAIDAAGPTLLYLSSLDANDEPPSLTNPPLANASANSGSLDDNVAGIQRVRTNAARQIRARIDASQSNPSMWIATLGWIDPRGRD